jgi:hypothetical protein
MTWLRSAARCVAACAVCIAGAASAESAEWFVSPGGAGPGTSSAPFGRVQDAVNVAQPGDVVTIRPGTYVGSVRTVRSGVAGKPIRIRSSLTERGSVILTTAGRVLKVDHAYITVEALVLDAQYAAADTLQITTAANYFVLRNVEVRRSTQDLVDLEGPSGVLIEHCLIHHALNAAKGRTDAHGIVAGPVRNLTIRNTEIHTFSGDGLQIDPGRLAPGWQNVTLDSVRIWLAPLPTAQNGFAAGAVPGENAVDTKASATLARATLTIRNTTASGFRNGLIGNMAAFNLKENINATLDRVTVFDSEIAFRLRGGGTASTGAWVTVKNAVVHDVLKAYLYEDNIQNLRIWNNTVGRSVTRMFDASESAMTGLNVRNLLMLGTRPREAAHGSNMSVPEQAFVDPVRHDYRLAAGATAIDSGLTIASVSVDRNGVTRSIGSGYDIGAYEWQPADSGEIAVHAVSATAVAGAWRLVPDLTAAGGARLSHPDAGAMAVNTPKSDPANYVEFTVPVEAGRAYRLWLRGRADHDSPQNDSVFVQFSAAVSSSGAPLYPIGTSSATTSRLEDCTGCGLRGWGWQDNGTGVEFLGPVIRFAMTGLQTIRIQTCEDGFSFDQLVLSPAAYLTVAPGALKADTVILHQAW